TIAVIGALLAAFATSVLVRRMKARTLGSKPQRVVVVAFGGLFLLNALTLAHRFGALRDVHPPQWSYTALAFVVLLGCTWFLLSKDRSHDASRRRDVPLWVATAAGAGYGCFSGLWHCCTPLWAGSMGMVSANALWFAVLALALGAVGRLAASARVVLGEALG